MHAVGRVGTFVSQGLYTVSGPFHPFGGAVDIIVVKQEDGTYKSSPWYVKFGKFQGVLKRSEKVVHVAVNDEQAKFHMYLDATGEAYFLKDAESDKEESSASHSLAISSGDEVSAVKPDSTKSEDGLDNKATDEEAEKGEDSDEKDRNLALKFEGRKASYLLVQQAAEEAKIEPVLSENGLAKAEDIDSKSSINEPSSELLASLATLRLKNGSVAELENATGGSAIHAFINQAAGLDKSQKPGRPSASLVAQAALASVARAATQECGPQVEEMSRAQSEIPEAITSRDQGPETVNGENKRDNGAEELGAGLEDRCAHTIQVVRDGREVIAEGFQLEISDSPDDRGGQAAEDRSRVKRARSESDLRLYESGDTSPEVSTLMITSADGVVVLHTPRRGSPPPLPLQEEQRQHCAHQNTRSFRHNHETEMTRNVETQTSVSKEELQSITDASVTEADAPRKSNGVVVSEGPGVSRSASESRVSEIDVKNKIGDLADVNNATIVSRTAVHFPTNVGEVDHGRGDVLQTEGTAVGGAEETMKSAKWSKSRDEFVESNGTFLKEDGSPSAGRLQEVEGSIGSEKKAQSGEENNGALERMEGPGNLSDTARSVELISCPKLKVAVERELAWRDAVHMASAALKVAPLSANRRRTTRYLERKPSSGDLKASPKRKSSSDRLATEEHAKIPDENAEKRSWGWWGWRGSTPSRPTSELGDKKDMKEFKESAEESNAEEQKCQSVIESDVGGGKDSGDAVEEVDVGSKVVQKGEKTQEVQGDVREAGSLEHAGEEMETCYEDSGAGKWRSNDEDAMKHEVVEVKSKASNGKVTEKKGKDEQTTPKVGQRTGTENDLTSSRRRSILGLMFGGYDKDQIARVSDAQISEPTIHEKGGSEAGDLVEGKDSENEYHPAMSKEISQGESEKLGALEDSQPHEETVHEESVRETMGGAPKIVEGEGVMPVSRDALVNAAEGESNGSEFLDVSVNNSSSGLSSESASSLHIENAASESSDITGSGNLIDGESKKKADFSLEKNRLPFTRIGGDYGVDVSAASSDSIFDSPSVDLKDSSTAFQGEEEVAGYDDNSSEIDIHMLPTSSPASSAVESSPEGKKEVSFALSLFDNSAQSRDEKLCGDEIYSSDIPGSKGKPSSNSDSDGDGPSQVVVVTNGHGIVLSIPADSLEDRKPVAIADEEEVMGEQVLEDGQLQGVVGDSSRSVEYARSPSGTKLPTSPKIKDFLDKLRNKVDSESEENVEVDGDEGADDSGSEDKPEQYLSEKRRNASSRSIYFDANTSDEDEEDRQGNVSGEEEAGSKWARSSPMSIPGVRGDSNAIYLDVENGSGVWPLSESLPLDRTKFTDVEMGKCNLSRSVGSEPLSHVQSSASPKLASQDISKSSVETSQRQVIENDAGVSEQLENELSEEEHVESEEEDKLHKTGIELSLCKHLLKERMGSEEAQKAFNSAKISVADFRVNGASIATNDKLVVRVGGQYYPWISASPLVLGMLAFGQVTSQEIQGAIQVEKPDPSPSSKDVGALVTTGSGGWKLWPFPLRRPKTPERSGSAPLVSREALLVAAGAGVDSALMNNLVSQSDYYLRSRKHKVRSFLPTSQMLASMNLKEGSNRITFTFFTRVLGRQQVDARIYLWKWDTRVVISDVDGTITKSDVLGQVMPLVGKDWTQLGVTRLFSAIKENGYEVVFLSARAISQAYLTRQFLLNLKQDGEALPDGPVVISPDGLFPSLYREVIRRAPHEFKIACLQDIRDLFPKDCNPFYAGFGNRDTDEISYLKVGIPKGKIFIINPKGEVAVNNRVDVKSYTSLHKLVDDMFPPQTYTEQEDYNTWNYWKMPLPDVEDELTVKSGSKSKRTKS